MRLALILAALLSGCTSPLQRVTEQTQQVSDELTSASMAQICDLQMMVTWRKYFGTDLARATAWQTLCAPIVISPKP